MSPGAESRRLPIWAILPVKQIDAAKQRLSNVLSAAERQELFRNMLADFMLAISQAKLLAGLLVVTRDVEVQALVRKYGARLLLTDTDDGQSAAVTAGASMLAREGVSSIITLAGDVPLMTATEIDTVCRSLAAAPAVTIVPSYDETGTNSIACSPPRIIPFMFGESSLPRHLCAAHEHGVKPRVLRLTGMALDIDVVSDLAQLLRYETTTATQRLLIANGIAQRLEPQQMRAPGYADADVDSQVKQ